MMTVRMVFLCTLFSVVPLSAASYHSSALGWTAGEDVTTAFAGLFDSTLGSGDELILDDIYEIGGTHQLPDDFTLSAVKGAGFDVIDATPDNGSTFLLLGNRTVLRNLTITYVGTPAVGPQGTNPTRGVDFFPRTGVAASAVEGVRVEHCRFYGSIGHHLKLNACAAPQVLSTHFVGGYWTVVLGGDVTDAVFRDCVFEKCQGDGIKTLRAGSQGVKRPLVENCVFQDCGRDGIDTTGGWKDAIVRGCTFRRLFSGMDIKSFFEAEEHLSTDCMNTGILIEQCEFTDMGSCITFSTIDRGLQYNDSTYFLDSASAQLYAPHDIDINDCIFERTSAYKPDQPDGIAMNMLLLKGGHSVRYSNAQFLGNGIREAKYSNVFDTFGPGSLSEEVSDALNHSVSGTLGAAGPARAPGDTTVSFEYGPQDDAGVTEQRSRVVNTGCRLSHASHDLLGRQVLGSPLRAGAAGMGVNGRGVTLHLVR